MGLTVRIAYDWHTPHRSVLELLDRPAGAYSKGSERAVYYDAKSREEANFILMRVQGNPGMRVEFL